MTIPVRCDAETSRPRPVRQGMVFADTPKGKPRLLTMSRMAHVLNRSPAKTIWYTLIH